MSGKKTATLALDQSSPVTGDVTFTATQSGFPNENLLWVSVHCFDANDVVASIEFVPIQWPDGTAGPFSTSDNSNPFAGDIVRGEGYIFEYPNTATPIRDTTVDFDVA